MPRTSTQAVEGIIEYISGVSLVPFVAMANSLTNWLDSNDTDGELDDATLELIERNLAAHFYQANRDRNFSSKQTQNASGVFQGLTTMGLMSTDPGQTACTLDTTGLLAARNADMLSGKRRKPVLGWLGTTSDSDRPDDYALWEE